MYDKCEQLPAALFQPNPICCRIKIFWPFQHKKLYLVNVVTEHEMTMHCLVQTPVLLPQRICSSWRWRRLHVPYHQCPKEPSESTISNKFPQCSDIKTFQSSKNIYLHISFVDGETLRKVVQTKRRSSICTRYKCIICISSENRTFSSSIFATQNHFLFR